MGELVAVKEAELREGFLHLMDSAGAVEQLDRVRRFGKGVGSNDREKGNGLARTSGHLKETVSLGV